MKEQEFNDLNLRGDRPGKYAEQQRFPEDPLRGQIPEDPTSGQEETFRAAEIQTPSGADGEGKAQSGSRSPHRRPGALQTTITSKVGAFAGVIASSVSAALIVVAAVVGTLSVNLSLLLADAYSLVFRVEVSGWQEEKEEIPLSAVLTGEDGFLTEQHIFPDTRILAFYDLQPGKEYTLVIRSEEKVFAEQSYLTAAEQTEKGRIYAESFGGEVMVMVEGVRLDRGEFYTVEAQDAKGETVWVRDSTEPFSEYRFPVSGYGTLYLTLSVGGKACAFTEVEIFPDHDPIPDPDPTAQYDTEEPIWNWANDYSAATVAFSDRSGGDPLVLQARIDVMPYESCDESYIEYFARASYDGWDYTDVQSEPMQSLGHAYGEIAEEIPASCEENGISAHYYCERCGSYFDADYNEVSYEDLIIAAPGHAYHAPAFEWNVTGNGEVSAIAVFTCERDSEHVEEVEAQVEPGVTDGSYTATVVFDDATYTNVYTPGENGG